MAEIKKGKRAQKDEIDDYAKALLHKKTEMALYPEDQSNQKKTKSLSQEELSNAEESLSSALDLLRLERGQLPIEEEEKQFSGSQEIESEKDLDTFTTSSIHLDPLSNNTTLESIYTSIEEKENKANKSVKEEKKLKKVSSKKKKTISSKKEKQAKTATNPKPNEKTESKKQEKEEKKKETKEESKPKAIKKEKKPHPYLEKLKQHWKGILLFLVIFALLLGGYAYKVVVYDPQNITTAEQESIYKKLVEYADEWDMLSEAEKMELIDLEDEYNQLLEKQQKNLNAYFVEQTGQDFDTQLAALKDLRTQQEDQTKPEYQELVAYVSNWSTKSDEEKAQILNYKAMYESLSDALKQQIDAIANEQSGSSFAGLIQQKEQADQQAIDEAAQAEQERQEQIAPLQAQIDALNEQLAQAQAYGQSLIQDQMAGEDLQASIDMNNETIHSLQAQIADLQSQILAIQ